MTRSFSAAGANYVGVRDLAASVVWYKQKFGLKEIEVEMDDGVGCVALGFSDDEYMFTLGPAGTPTDELRPMLFVSNIKKARDLLGSRGVSATDVQVDAQGTHFFEIRDLEGNVIEVSEEP